MKKMIILTAFFSVVSSVSVYAVLTRNFHKETDFILNSTTIFLDESIKQERLIIENYPIYDDWIRDNDESMLRKYLYHMHVASAKKKGVGPVKNDDEIAALTSDMKLIRLSDSDAGYYFYGVPEKYRYLVPSAEKMLEEICTRVNEKLREKGIKIKVKVAVSSALRPSAYQNDLSGKNMNAVDESTHSYGVSLDLFYDDYYVVFPEKNDNDVSAELYSRVRGRLGFIMGDSLRRQFHTILASALLEMQNEGLIYVINEKRQKCFHVTIAEF